MKKLRAKLFPPLFEGVSPQALHPLLVAGMVVPVENGDGGINFKILDNSPDSGVLSVINAYRVMSENDQVSVHLGDEHILDVPVTPRDVGKPLYFYLPKTLFQPDWVTGLYFQVLRPGETSPEESLPLSLRVKLNLPGGVDREPHKPGHSELPVPQLPDDIIENGVDAKWAEEGFNVSIGHYPDRAARDTVELLWGSVRVLRLISEEEAAGTGPIDVAIDQAVILAAGDSDALKVNYYVFDEVWNYSSAPSRDTHVKVQAGAWWLDAPIIQESVNGVIDLIELGPNDVEVKITMQGAPFLVDDSIELNWIGTPLLGPPLVHTDSQPIKSVPGILTFTVPNADIRAIASGKGDAWYVLRKANGEKPESSKHAFTSVVGELSNLPAPIILQAVGDLLDSRMEYAWVEAGPYPGMVQGDVVNLIWKGTLADGNPYLYEDDQDVSENMVGHPVGFLVPAEHIAALNAGALELYYQVTSEGAIVYDVRDSASSYFKVLQLRYELPAPRVEDTDGDVLDPEVVIPNGAVLWVDYIETEAQDVLTYYWQSVYIDGTISDWVPITVASKGRPVSFRIPAAAVEVSRGTTINVLYSLKRGN